MPSMQMNAVALVGLFMKIRSERSKFLKMVEPPKPLITLQKKAIRESILNLKFPKVIADLLDEFVGYSPTVIVRLRADRIGEQIRRGYQRWLQARINPGIRDTEYDCKYSIWAWFGQDDPMFEGSIHYIAGYFVDPIQFGELMYYLE